MLRLSCAWIQQNWCQDPFHGMDRDGSMVSGSYIAPAFSPYCCGVGSSLCSASSLSVSQSFFVSRVSAPGYSRVWLALAQISFNGDVIAEPSLPCARQHPLCLSVLFIHLCPLPLPALFKSPQAWPLGSGYCPASVQPPPPLPSLWGHRHWLGSSFSFLCSSERAYCEAIVAAAMCLTL